MAIEKGKQPDSIDDYLTRVPDEHRDVLINLRELIRSTAPDAVESISYGIPTYKLNGRPLVYFGNAKTHYAVYALSAAVRDKFKNELADYSLSKGTIRFPFDKPLPKALIKKMVKAAIEENGEETAAKKSKLPKTE
jgi:uncharacterized protein YdhG (YjbR/CyaY superfamily)